MIPEEMGDPVTGMRCVCHHTILILDRTSSWLRPCHLVLRRPMTNSVSDVVRARHRRSGRTVGNQQVRCEDACKVLPRSYRRVDQSL